ncbi:GNAT family N-acetyltransferase [Maliponia aquimaris]|uniref:Aminoalkylphosphonic acid N-acetyltransferase n=1 Tax=Maliponia aquimaris TaxID=1673631 RepID=A0A238KA20_9RHOB|nr:GNAT family N-acetyltransferase [Maliponia aquimaris]SMX39254.1 aminoalkylphosphonic acid N-acetyltransferase [Maliponia aquimaris]
MITLRRATAEDLPALVALLADDPLGAAREDASLPLADCYTQAFDAIDADPNQLLVVATRDGTVIGCLQLSFLPGLSRRGAWRGQIESVRVAPSARGLGLGRQMIDWAIETCRTRGCTLVQLTSDTSRPDAHRFYESLGFVPSHTGFKLPL